MTNETVFGYTFIGFPNVFEDPSKVDPTKVGFNNKLLYKNGVAQIPNFGGGSEAAQINNYGGYEAGGAQSGLYANKYMPSFSDTVTKVVGRHTIKAGFFWEWIRNAQPASNNSMGNLRFSNSNSNSLGNDYADMLIGNLNTFQQYSFNRINDISYRTYEGFVQDSWKMSKKPDARTRRAHQPLHAVDRPAGLRLLRVRRVEIQHQLHAGAVLRLAVEQARQQRADGRVPGQERVLPAALRHGL